MSDIAGSLRPGHQSHVHWRQPGWVRNHVLQCFSYVWEPCKTAPCTVPYRTYENMLGLKVPGVGWHCQPCQSDQCWSKPKDANVTVRHSTLSPVSTMPTPAAGHLIQMMVDIMAWHRGQVEQKNRRNTMKYRWILRRATHRNLKSCAAVLTSIKFAKAIIRHSSLPGSENLQKVACVVLLRLALRITARVSRHIQTQIAIKQEALFSSLTRGALVMATLVHRFLNRQVFSDITHMLNQRKGAIWHGFLKLIVDRK